jgi:uncharacterized membrane protein
MDFKRLWRHLCTSHWTVRRMFGASTRRAIAETVRLSETTHRGEIRFAVEGSLELLPLLHGRSAHDRALEIFSQLRVWDTEENNGVLIYLLVADHHVEIIADRGVHTRAGTETWEEICRAMEVAFRQGRFETGIVEGIRSVTAVLAREYPASGSNPNELPDEPVFIR